MLVHGGPISAIDVSEPTSWKNVIFLTFDVDWAHDEVLADTIEIVEAADVPATWFITHDTPLLARLRDNPKFELGIHPNFNRLLEGDGRNGANAREVVERLMSLVPEARSVRSHSMMQSSQLLQVLADAGLTHDVNHFIPASVWPGLKPWKLWNGMTRVPYFWEDDIYCLYRESSVPEPDVVTVATAGGELKVFDFHPIHVFLNTEHLDRYERTRPLHQDPAELSKHRFEGYGTRSRLLELLAATQPPVATKAAGPNDV